MYGNGRSEDPVGEAIPKASTTGHVRENAAARDLHLGATDLERLDRAFPPPTRQEPLAML